MATPQEAPEIHLFEKKQEGAISVKFFDWSILAHHIVPRHHRSVIGRSVGLAKTRLYRSVG